MVTLPLLPTHWPHSLSWHLESHSSMAFCAVGSFHTSPPTCCPGSFALDDCWSASSLACSCVSPGWIAEIDPLYTPERSLCLAARSFCEASTWSINGVRSVVALLLPPPKRELAPPPNRPLIESRM